MQDKINLRPQLDIVIGENQSLIEQFQNQTLRPILKLQNHLLLSLFQAYALLHNLNLHSVSREKRTLLIQQSISKDAALKNLLVGTIIRMLTSGEADYYNTNSKEVNRRIATLIMQRIDSQLV